MKINEKNLCMFATTPPVDVEGWLNKRGEINKSWQKRWFVLKGNLLFYFERKGDREPLGMIILEGCTVELAEDGEQYCFQVIFHGPNNRTYYLSTETQSNMEQWMKALTCAGYDYMKLMVAELQRQLDEIEGTKEKTPEISPLPPPKAPPRRQNPFNKPPVEYASNAVFVSPQVIRKAPTVPVGLSAVSSPSLSSRLINLELKSPSEITPVSEYQNETSQTPASESSITGLSRSASGISSKSSTGSGNGVLNVVDLLAVVSDEWSFERMHSLLGTPVLADLHARKITMEKKSEQPPLILF